VGATHGKDKKTLSTPEGLNNELNVPA